MKQFFQRSFAVTVVISLCFFTSCSEDAPNPFGNYVNGVFVINEGNFGDGDGSISFYNRGTGEVEQTVFQNVNGVEAFGDVVQSATSFNDLTYIVVNNSNKVEVVNSYTFESQFTMTDVELPRYMVVGGDAKGYLTQWVSFTDPGKVSIFNLETGEIESEIEVGSLPEDIQVIGDKIYVTEAFSSPNLYIIDTSNDNAIEIVTLGNGTNQLVVDRKKNLWIACGGGDSGFPDYTPNNDGKLIKFDTETNEIVTEIELNTNYAGKIAINNDLDGIHFFIENSVYEVGIDENMIGDPLFTVDESFGFNGIDIDFKNHNILVTDAKDYIQDGQVYVYSREGAPITSFTTGRIPNGFVFN